MDRQRRNFLKATIAWASGAVALAQFPSIERALTLIAKCGNDEDEIRHFGRDRNVSCGAHCVARLLLLKCFKGIIKGHAGGARTASAPPPLDIPPPELPAVQPYRPSTHATTLSYTSQHQPDPVD